MSLESEVETLKLQIKNINHQVAINTKRFDTKQLGFNPQGHPQ